MSNDLPQNPNIQPQVAYAIDNSTNENRISRIGLITSGFAGFTTAIISHILIISHIKGVPLRKQIFPCLGIAGVGAITGLIANRSISTITKPPMVAESTPIIDPYMTTPSSHTEPKV